MPLLESRGSGSALAYGLNAFQDLGAVELIQTVSGGNAYFEFTNIPQSYKHLRLFFFARGTGSGTVDNTNVVVNGVTGSSYVQNQIYTDTAGNKGTGGTTTPSGPQAFMNYPTGGAPANYYGSGVVDFSDYTNPNKYKSYHIWTGSESNSSASGAYYIIMRAQLFISADPVTSLKFIGGSAFTSDSYMSLYGVKG